MKARQKDFALVTATASTLTGQTLRQLHRLTVARFVSFSTFSILLALLAVGVVSLLVLQSAQTGSALAAGSTDVVVLLTGLLFVCGSLSGLALVLCRDLWSRHIRAEAERLAVLPLGRRSLAVLALLPSLLPPLIGAVVGVLGIVAFCWGLGQGPLTPLTGIAFGMAFAMSVGLLWILVLRAANAPAPSALLTSLTVGGLVVHAGWTTVQHGASPGAPHAWSPVVMALGRETPFSWWHSVVAVSLLVGLTWLFVEVDLRGHTRRRGTSCKGTTVRRSGMWLPPAGRVAWEVLLTIVRQSSIRSEVGLSLALCGGAAWVAGRMEQVGRGDAAASTVVVAAVFSALPVLGLRSSLGPSYRLWLLGARASDVRAGFIAAASLCAGAGVLAALVVLQVMSSSTGLMLLILLWAAVSLGVATIVSIALRGVASTSIGRMAATVGLLIPTLTPLFAGMDLMASWPILAVAAVSLGAAAVYVRASLREEVIQ